MSDHQQDENKLIAERRGKLAQIRENCPSNGFPNQFDRKH
ncbi:MAG: lysyl-tRNA synthetase class 2, partial [Bermanella sp.]